jgi:hypothetical protein
VDREFDIVNRERAHALLHQIDQALMRWPGKSEQAVKWNSA